MSDTSQPPILLISGTNRPDSNALRVTRVLERHYREQGATTDLLNLTELPGEVFEGSAYATKPPAMVEIQNRVLRSRGLHVVSPEYNGSFPGVLKYFIDMLKFPESFDRRPVAYVGEAAGVWGGLRAVEQLQLIFGYRNAFSFPERVFIPAVRNAFDQAGNLTDPEIDKRLAKQVAGFLRFIDCVCTINRAEGRI
jgi:NAD(P)H-dependent FMN reductase